MTVFEVIDLVFSFVVVLFFIVVDKFCFDFTEVAFVFGIMDLDFMSFAFGVLGADLVLLFLEGEDGISSFKSISLEISSLSGAMKIWVSSISYKARELMLEINYSR